MIQIKVPAALHTLIKQMTLYAPSNTCERVMYQWAQTVLTEAKRITPVDKGILKGSLGVNVEIKGRKVEAEFFAGGPASSYAEIVHDNHELNHAYPTQANFLGQPIENGVPELEKAIQKAIEEELRKF